MMRQDMKESKMREQRNRQVRKEPESKVVYH